MTSIARPDERATEEEIRQSRQRNSLFKRGASAAIGVGTAAIGGKLAQQIAPFLSEYIPVDLALKGINKISPKFGDILKKGMKEGLNIEDGLNYLRENILQKNQQEQQTTQDDRNIIEQYSPELKQFIESQIQEGRSPLEAGALATLNKQFKPIIDKMSKDHKSPWSAILESIYGTGEQAAQQQPIQRQNAQSQQMPPQQGMPQGQPQQGGQDSNQMLMAALERIMQM